MHRRAVLGAMGAGLTSFAGCSAPLVGSSQEEYELTLQNNHHEAHTITVNYTGTTTVRFHTTLRAKTNATIRNIPYERGTYRVVVSVDGKERAEFSPGGFYLITIEIDQDGSVAVSGPVTSD